MPAYPHLMKPVKFSDLPTRVKAVAALGDYYNPFTKDPNMDPIEDARAQAKQIIAEIIESDFAKYGNVQLDKSGRPVRNEDGSPLREEPSIPYGWILDDQEQTAFYGGRGTEFSETQMIALIAYMQRLGVDLLSDDEPVPVDADEDEEAVEELLDVTTEEQADSEPQQQGSEPDEQNQTDSNQQETTEDD